MKNKSIGLLTVVFTCLIAVENSSQAGYGGAVAGGLIGGAVVGSAIANSRARRYDDYAYWQGQEDARREQFYREQRARQDGW